MGLNAIHGKNAVLYLGGTGVAVAVAEQVDYQIDMDTSESETTSLPNAAGVVWKTFLRNPIGWTGKLSGNFDPTTVNLWDASVTDSTVPFYLYPSASAMSKYYYGTAFVSLKPIIAGGQSKNMTNACDLKGSGVLSHT